MKQVVQNESREEAAEVCSESDETQLYDLKGKENKSPTTHYSSLFTLCLEDKIYCKNIGKTGGSLREITRV